MTLNRLSCDLLYGTGQRIPSLIEPNNLPLTKASLPKTHPTLIQRQEMVAVLETSGKVKLLLQLPQCLNVTWRREHKLTTPTGFKEPGSSSLFPCAVGGTTQH